MSTYTRIARHPQTRKYEYATFIDDYFAPHIYGVHFESDDKVYPLELVDKAQIYDFWKDDVLAAFMVFLYGKEDQPYTEERAEDELQFLNLIEEQYKARWRRDPETGEGATIHSAILKER